MYYWPFYEEILSKQYKNSCYLLLKSTDIEVDEDKLIAIWNKLPVMRQNCCLQELPHAYA